MKIVKTLLNTSKKDRENILSICKSMGDFPAGFTHGTRFAIQISLEWLKTATREEKAEILMRSLKECDTEHFD